MRHTYLLGIILTCLLAISGSAQERPKVGLVLSGGAAHGLAHIGVLKAIEEAGVQVDYVTGTSMGSIIGALFAMGYDAKQIEEITYQQPWDVLISTSVPLQEIAPSEKKYHGRYPLTMVMKDGGFSLPQGFLNTQKLDLTMTDMFSPADGLASFDDLPIPFRCVSIDIETGDIVVIGDGDLGTAVRASMAIPSVFTPVEREGRLLVDGGLIRNFPVQEARDLGADIIIGVYVGSGLEPKDKLNNLVEILSQSAFMMGVLDSEEQKEDVDLLIVPDVKHLPTFGFDEQAILIREGYLAARDFTSEFEKIAADQKSYDIPQKRPLTYDQQVRVSGTRFGGMRSPFDALARFKYANKRRAILEMKEIESGIDRMFGTKHFENINYSFDTNDAGNKILSILAEPRETKAISGTFNYLSTSNTSLILTGEFRNIINNPSVLYLTGRFSEDFGMMLDYNYRLGAKKNFMLSILTKFHKYDQRLYQGETLRSNFKQLRLESKIGIGYEPNNRWLSQLSFGVDRSSMKPEGLDPDGLEQYFRLDGVAEMSFRYEYLDNPQFAMDGARLHLDLGYHHPLDDGLTIGVDPLIEIPVDRAYASVDLKGDAYVSLGGVLVGGAHISAGWKSEESLLDNYMLGGIEDRDNHNIELIGINTNQIHFTSYAKLGASARLDLFRPMNFTVVANYVKGETTFGDAATMGSDVTFWTYGAMLGARSPLGPLEFAYGYNTLTSSWNTNFRFGYTFF